MFYVVSTKPLIMNCTTCKTNCEQCEAISRLEGALEAKQTNIDMLNKLIKLIQDHNLKIDIHPN